jgi:hypothetical protein
MLASVLASEAQRWISIGQQLEYFAPGEIPQPGRSAALAEGQFFETTGPLRDDVDEGMFGRLLSHAREDLTPDRQVFLGLMFFETFSGFTERLSEVKQLAEALDARPWLSLPSRAVDRIGWSLEGAELNPVATRWSPSLWRTDVSHQAWRYWDGHPTDGAAIERWNALNEARSSIAAAMLWNIEYAETPVELRAALVGRSRQQGEPPEVWLPTWAQEADSEAELQNE